MQREAGNYSPVSKNHSSRSMNILSRSYSSKLSNVKPHVFLCPFFAPYRVSEKQFVQDLFIRWSRDILFEVDSKLHTNLIHADVHFPQKAKRANIMRLNNAICLVSLGFARRHGHQTSQLYDYTSSNQRDTGRIVPLPSCTFGLEAGKTNGRLYGKRANHAIKRHEIQSRVTTTAATGMRGMSCFGCLGDKIRFSQHPPVPRVRRVGRERERGGRRYYARISAHIAHPVWPQVRSLTPPYHTWSAISIIVTITASHRHRLKHDYHRLLLLRQRLLYCYNYYKHHTTP